jgi:hypothetical protein
MSHMLGGVICHTGCYTKVLQFPQSLYVAGRQLYVSALQAQNCPHGLQARRCETSYFDIA